MSQFQGAISHALETCGIKELKDKQLEAVSAFVDGKDVFVSLPTGYGKSLIYGILPLVFDKLKGTDNSLVVCVSPLTSIMMDQSSKFSLQGLKTAFVGEAQDDYDVVKKVLNGDVQLLFISPESLISNELYRNMLLTSNYKERMVALAVDEAHCVKTWGDSFRVAFSEIGSLRSIIPPKVNVLALTATATKQTYDVVCERLALSSPVLIGMTPHRSNIKYCVKPFIKQQELVGILCKEINQCSIKATKTVVFCRRLEDTAMLYLSLRHSLGTKFTYPEGVQNTQSTRLVDMYTRACRPEFQQILIDLFMKPDSILRVVIATTAFGMGIDCPNIGRIIHWGTPTTLEQYAQETGRSGRDGKDAEAILFYKKGGRHIEQSVHNYCQEELECRRKTLFKSFLFYNYVETVNKCKCCDICGKTCSCELCN